MSEHTELWKVFENKFSDKDKGGIPSYIMPSVRIWFDELELTSHCVYCGFIEVSNSMIERFEKVVKHTLECDKRPEVRMLTEISSLKYEVEELKKDHIERSGEFEEKIRGLMDENEALRKVVDLVKEYSTIWVSSRGKDMTRGWELIHEIAEALEAVKDEAKEGV